ncbi:MAG: hypothetical protein UX23_C0003G0004 [Parcubacteria group bacterium GW2011_GWB1_45_9]|nr:MAG: hypothetical protein UX23_C0003G0004 [Parcubacteria group bacterium GW2011_GWB1_45_9]
MTIIQPYKKLNMSFYALGASALIILCSVWAIYLYNSTVNTRYAISEKTKSLEELSVENADFRSAVSRLISSENMELSAERLNLKKERHPEYFSTKWPLVSHF